MVKIRHQRHEGNLHEIVALLRARHFVPTPFDLRRLGALLHSDPSTNEELVVELCRLPDERLEAFCATAFASEVPEATDVVEAVILRRGILGLGGFVAARMAEDRPALWLADLLAEVRDDGSTRILLELLDHHSVAVRSRAAEGLRAHRSRVDARALVRQLAEPLVRERDHPDPFLAVRCLHRLAEPSLEPDFGRDCARRAERVLINCVVHERRQAVRGDAIAALGDLGSRAAVRCLVEALNREDQGLHQDGSCAAR